MAAETSTGSVTCSHCNDNYRDPRILSCLHYVCKECIQQLANNNQPFPCPQCRKYVAPPENDAREFEKAHFVTSMVRMHDMFRQAERGEPIQCKCCETPGVAQAFCHHPSCAMFICEACSLSHKSMRILQDHAVVPLEEMKQNLTGNLRDCSAENCEQHKEEPLTYYCNDCREILCSHCMRLRHDGHNCDTIKNCSQNCEGELKEQLSPLKAYQGRISRATDDVKGVKSMVTNQVVNTEEEIHRAFAEVRKAIDAHQQELLDTIRKRADEKKEQLENQLEELNSAASDIHGLTGFVGNCLEYGSNVDILTHRTKILDRLQDELKRSENLPLERSACAAADIAVDVSSCSERIHEVLQEYATVITILPADPSQCTIEGEGTRLAETNAEAKFTLHAAYSSGQPCREIQDVTAELKSQVDNSTTIGVVNCQSADTYEISCHPKIRGRCQLIVRVNGTPIAGSPFSVYVIHPPQKLGNPVRRIYGLGRPYGAAFHLNGDLLVTDSIARPDNKTATSGTSAGIAVINGEDSIERKAQSKLNNPTGIAVDKDGCIYVIGNDNENESVIKYDKDWSLMKSTGGKEGFKRPGRVTISPKNELYICDRGNRRIKVCDTNLEFLPRFENIEFQRPVDIAFDDDGNIYVTELNGDCISKLNPEGEKLQVIGGLGDLGGSQPGRLRAPRGILIHQNCIYVCERDNTRISVFQTDGEFVTTFGAQAGLHDPASIVVDKDGFIYVCDEENACVVVF